MEMRSSTRPTVFLAVFAAALLTGATVSIISRDGP